MLIDSLNKSHSKDLKGGQSLGKHVLKARKLLSINSFVYFFEQLNTKYKFKYFYVNLLNFIIN